MGAAVSHGGSCGLFSSDFLPVRVGPRGLSRFVLVPVLDGVRVKCLEEEKEPSVGDFEIRRINFDLFAFGHRRGAPTTVGRQIFFRCSSEELLVGVRRKKVSYAAILRAE